MGLRRLAILLFLFAPAALCQQYPFVPAIAPDAPKDIQVLLQDSRGRIWAGTLNDLVSFDGSHFYSLHELGYPETAALGLAEDSEGGIWSATRAGIFDFHDGRLDRVAAGLATSIVSIAPGTMLASLSKDDPKWVPSTPTLLYKIRKTGQSWNVEQLSDLKTTGFLTVDAQGTAIFPCPDGWCELTRQQIVDWQSGQKETPVFHNYKSTALRILRDHRNCIWFRGGGGAGFQCPGDPAIHLFADAGMLDDYANMFQTPDDWIIILGPGRMKLASPETARTVIATNGLPDTNAVLQTKDGTLWVGGSKGLFRLAHRFQLEYWTERDGLEDPLSIVRVGGNTYAASGQGIKMLSRKRQNWQSLENSQRLGFVTNLHAGPQNTIYAAFFQGVAQLSLDGNLLALSPLGDQYAGTKLVEDAKGQLWLSGIGVRSVRRAAKQLVLGEAQNQKLLNGPSPILELDAEYDKQRDRLWTCGPKGLSVRQGQAWRDIASKDGMLQDFCITLAVLDNGDAWYGYGYTSNAFDRLRLGPSGEVNIQHYYPDLPGSANHFFDVDQRGWLWRGAVDGIYVATPEKAAANEWVRVEEADGLVYDSGNQQSFYGDPDGSVWFATGNAIVHFSPTQDFLQSATVPDVHISGFSWDGGTAKLSETLSGIPHGSVITANLGSLYFDHRSDLRVRYRLLPEQRDWKEDRKLELRLGKLAWGQHILEVQARVGSGNWSSTATQAFWVQRPIWLSWPALLSFVTIAVAASFGLRKWETRRKALASRSLPALTPWRVAVLLPEVQDLVGKQLDSRYEVGELLARGGFANVMDGYDRKEKRRCAIKIFRNEVGKNESMQKRFEQEVSALQQVRHPHVVSIYAHGTTASGTPYLVMEFVEGKSLREILNDGPLAPARAARILCQLGEALEAIHQKGICHRDVKPENVMVRNPETPNEEAVLIDFSISLVKEADETLHGLSRAAGTFEYMAPEQAIGYARPSSDIYSLAKLLIEMLTGQRLAALLPNASMDLPVRIREVLSKLPVSFSETSLQLISMALEFDPTRRPENVGAFVACIVQDLELAQIKV